MTALLFSPFGQREAFLTLTLVVLMALDLLTGWAAAFVTGTTSSRVSWAGVTRKALTVAVVLVVGIVNVIAPSPLDQWPLLAPTLVGYVVSEVFSILENCKRAGVPLPSALERPFSQRRDT